MSGLFSSFFDLRDNPFRANPDPRYLFLTRQTKTNLDQIIEGIRARKGLLLLTGEVGTGKTVLLNRSGSSRSASPKRSFSIRI
jgi:general secretion pathway protein A